MKAHTLTSLDIAALKKADSVGFRRDYRDGKTTIEATKNAPKPSPSNPFPQESRHEIETTSGLSSYFHMTKDELTHPAAFATSKDLWKAWHWISSARFCDEWQGIAYSLRKGDSISLEWVACNNSQTISKAGLVLDELKIRVERGDRSLTFLVAVQVSSVETLAGRMIQ